MEDEININEIIYRIYTYSFCKNEINSDIKLERILKEIVLIL